MSDYEAVVPGTYWRHRNGNEYRVLMITNESSKQSQYPKSVVYEGQNGRLWSRPLSDWHRSMGKIDEPEWAEQ